MATKHQPLHRHYSPQTQPKNGNVIERIVINNEDITFPEGRIAERGIWGAVEISVSGTNELEMHFVLGVGYLPGQTYFRYTFPDTPKRIVESLMEAATQVDPTQIAWSTELDVNLAGFYLNQAVERERLLATLAARWFAGYIANNYKITAEIVLKENQTIADSHVEVTLLLPWGTGCGMGYFCSPTRKNYSQSENLLFQLTP